MKSFILIISVLFSLNLHAGGERGNGGDAVLIGGKYFLFDLVEAGVEQDTYWNTSIKIYPKVLREVSKSLSPAIYPTELIAKKISEIGNEDPVFAWLMVSAIQKYNWSIVTLPVVEIPDTGETELNPPPGTVVQAAVRNKDRISIFKSVWSDMDSFNRSALILHEVIYSLVRPELVDLNDPNSQWVQDGVIARKIVGFAYSSAMSPQLNGWKWISEKYGKPTMRAMLPIGFTQDNIFESKKHPGSYFFMFIIERDADFEVVTPFLKNNPFTENSIKKICESYKSNSPQRLLAFYPLAARLSGVTNQNGWVYKNLWSEWNIDSFLQKPTFEFNLDSRCQDSLFENKVTNPLLD